MTTFKQGENHTYYGKPAPNRVNVTKEMFKLIISDIAKLKSEKKKAITIDRELGTKYDLSSGVINSIRTGKHWSNKEYGGN